MDSLRRLSALGVSVESYALHRACHGSRTTAESLKSYRSTRPTSSLTTCSLAHVKRLSTTVSIGLIPLPFPSLHARLSSGFPSATHREEPERGLCGAACGEETARMIRIRMICPDRRQTPPRQRLQDLAHVVGWKNGSEFVRKSGRMRGLRSIRPGGGRGAAWGLARDHIRPRSLLRPISSVWGTFGDVSFRGIAITGFVLHFLT